MVATVVTLEVQLEFAVRSWSGPSLKCPVAWNCTVSPTRIFGLMGEIAIPVKVLPPLPPPQVAHSATINERAIAVRTLFISILPFARDDKERVRNFTSL